MDQPDAALERMRRTSSHTACTVRVVKDMTNEQEIVALAPWENHVVLGWLANVAGRVSHGRPEAVAVVDWLADNLGLLGLEKTLRRRLKETLRTAFKRKRTSDADDDCSARRRRRRTARRMRIGAWNALRRDLDAGRSATVDAPPDQLGRHLRKLGEHLDLASSGSLSLFRRRRNRRSESKIFLNRLLEETSAPTLWITNHAGAIDRAILRRMMFALEIRQPPAPVRARVWSRQLERHRIEATDDDAAALAREFDAAPGVAAGATAAARLGGGDIEFVRRSVRSLSSVLGSEKPGRHEGPVFDPSLIEADFDLTSLVDRLAATGELRFSLCLTGPPGTGKSAYVRFLAERLGLETRQERASDLLSMWAGGSEKNIARAFARARDERTFLVFDEADSLLADRRRSGRRWEVSQVNEMLTWMESHPLPFACTTNYGENLDPATLRRFVFKVSIGYLGPESATAAFRLFFKLEPPLALRSLNALTPGDFAVVRRKAETLGQAGDPAALLAMLEAECLAKPDTGETIGFRA